MRKPMNIYRIYSIYSKNIMKTRFHYVFRVEKRAMTGYVVSS